MPPPDNYENLFFIPTPRTTRNLVQEEQEPYKDIIPATMILTKKINGKISSRLLKVLLDSGSTATMIHSSVLPKGCTPLLMNKPITSGTVQGSFKSKRWVRLKGVLLPEFDRSLRIEKQDALVFDKPCKYDVIVGRDFLISAGIDLKFGEGVVKWLN